MKRVVLLGGSFDPVHEGHLQIAKAAIKQCAVNEVWFLVAKHANLKNHHTSYDDRVAMVKLAVAPYRKFHVCEIEKDMKGTTYTIDVVKRLKKQYPFIDFSFIIGGDQIERLMDWKDSDNLQSLVHFIGVQRGEGQQRLPRMIRMNPIDVSSSMIRIDVLQKYQVNEVLKYGSQKGLYLEAQIQAFMSKKRYAHSQRVASLSAELARAHHLDEAKAYQAGLLHDLAKEIPRAIAMDWIRNCAPYLEEQPFALWHGPLGSRIAKSLFKIKDKEILQAITYHITGNHNAPLSMIVYIADKCERGRGYDTSLQIEIAKKDLKRAMEIVMKEQLAYIEQGQE